MERKIIGYRIEASYNSWDFASLVNNRIADGWEPYGPPFIKDEHSYIGDTRFTRCRFYQVMVKYEEVNNA